MKREGGTGDHERDIFHGVTVQLRLLTWGLRFAVAMFGLFAVIGLVVPLYWRFVPVAAVFVALTWWMKRAERPRIELVFAIGALMVIISQWVFGIDSTKLGAGLSTVMLLLASGVFVPFHRRAVLGTMAGLLLVGAGLLWDGPSAAGLVTGVTMALVSGFSLLVIRFVQIETIAADRNRQTTSEHLDRIPVAILNVDLRPLVAELRRLRLVDQATIEDHVRDRPDELERLTRLALVTGANAHASRTFSMDGVSFPTRLDANDVPAADRLVTIELLVVLTAGGTALDYTFRRPSNRGAPRWLRGTWLVPGGPSPDHGRAILAALDITEVIETQERLTSLTEAKDRFIASISHELRTPLAGIVGFSHALLDGEPAMTTEEGLELLGLIADQSLDMSHIVDDLLVAAKAETGQLIVNPELLEIGRILSKMVKNGRVHVENTVSEPLFAIADPHRLRQVFRNLFSNAERYGGANLRLVGIERDGRVTIEFRNDGPPVPSDVAERIFDPFVSAHRPSAVTESVGLGLWVSRYLSEAMGGLLEYREEHGEVVFAVTIPAPKAS